MKRTLLTLIAIILNLATVASLTLIPASNAHSADTVWVEDAVPSGGILAGDYEGWNFISANPAPFSGNLAHQSGIITGVHQDYFYNATDKLSIGTGDTLFTYIYLDPANPPSEVMLQWHEANGWEHRAYWGANSNIVGVDATASRHYMGPLPASGAWVRLEVAASAVGLEGVTLDGMAYTLFDGRATWDRAGKTSAATPLATAVYYIYADHLNTPRVITDTTNRVVWKWDSDPFGTDFPQEGTTQNGARFEYNLRFPGQYYDSETNLHYNYFRDYDPSTGRYVQSDPIGLGGGINTYAYVGGNPLSFTDPTGLLCVYSQGTGSLVCTNDTTGQQYLSCNGYAGNGAGLNNPAAQNQPNVGPLPQGDYTVGGFTRRRGPQTRPLTPAPGNSMFGRSAFLIHGDNRARNNTASEGCVIVDLGCRAGIPTGETLRVVP